MNRPVNKFPCLPSPVPRASGDEPENNMTTYQIALLFPAPAGMNRSQAQQVMARPSVPRASGDEPLAVKARIDAHRCSPRQRG